MRQSHLILANALVMWGTQFLQLLPPLILVPYLLGTIGEVGYGIYALVWSLIVSIEQLELSLQSGVVKYSAGFLAQGRTDDVNRVVSSSSVYSLGIAAIACAAILVASALIEDSTGQLGPALSIVGVMVLFIIPLTPYIAVIQSRQRYYIGAIAGAVSKYVSLLAVFAFYNLFGPSIGSLIAIMAVTLFLSKLVQVPIAYRLAPGLKNRPGLFSGSTLRMVAAFGAATVLAAACLAANSTGIRWLMDALVSTSFVAHLAIMLMPALLMGQIVSGMAVTIMPAASAYEATGNFDLLRELLVRGIRYTTILVLSGVLVAALLMKQALDIWVGGDYLFLAPYALALFASGAFMQSTAISHHMLKGIGRLRAVVLIYFFGLVVVPVTLIVSIFLIWRNPYLTATVGLAAGNLTCGCCNVFFCARSIGTSLRGLLFRSYAQPVLVALAAFALEDAFVYFLGLETLVTRLLVSVSAVLMFLAGCYFFIFTKPERAQFIELARAFTITARSLFLRRSHPEQRS